MAGSSFHKTASGWATACVAILVANACVVGDGEGVVSGRAHLPSCGVDGPFELKPNFFAATPIDEALEIRVQHGSNWETFSDGIFIFVHDANDVATHGIHDDIALGEGSAVDMTLYMNETCKAGRTEVPVLLPARAGTIRFHNIYAPQTDEDNVRIHAEFFDVHFEGSDDSADWTADISGYFDFLYVRGRPAQRFP